MDTDDCGLSPGGQCGPVLEDEPGAPPHSDGHVLLPNRVLARQQVKQVMSGLKN